MKKILIFLIIILNITIFINKIYSYSNGIKNGTLILTITDNIKNPINNLNITITRGGESRGEANPIIDN